MNWLRNARTGCDGSALVETALSLPLLAALFVGAADFGRLFYTAMTVTHAARAGAAYGLQSGKNNDTAGMQSAAATAATDISGFSATAVRLCHCYTGTLPPSPNPPTNAACSASCSGARWSYVQVTGTATFTTLVNYPGIPSSITITRVARMRAQ